MRDGAGGPMLCIGVDAPLREGATYFARLSEEDALRSVLDVEIVDLPPPDAVTPVPLASSAGVAAGAEPASTIGTPSTRRRKRRGGRS